jgi:cell wall-associated NlpC family hydrolase
VLALSVVASMAASPLGADPIDDARAEARRISDRLDELNLRVSVLDEEYNATRAELEEVEAQLVDAEAEIEQSESERSIKLENVREYAVEAYIGGSKHSQVVAYLDSDGSDFAERESYLQAATGDKKRVLEDLRAALEDLDTEVASTESIRGELEGLTAQLDERREEIESLISEQSDLLAGVESELGELIREEQERQAAEAAAAAERAAREAAATVAANVDAGDRPASAAAPGAAAAPATEPATPAPVAPNDPAPAPAPAAPPPQTSPPATAAPAPPPPPPASSSRVQTVLAEAQRQLGVAYRWAGSTPSSGFDCSGFTAWVWNAAGVYLPHSSRAQYSATRRVSTADMQPGDLVFFGSPIHHVGLYVGSGQMINSPRTGDVVRYANVYRRDLVGVGRIS